MNNPNESKGFSTHRPNPQPGQQSTSDTSFTMSRNAADARALVDKGLLDFVQGTNAMLEEYEDKATQVREYFRDRIADAITNQSLHAAIASDVAQMVRQNPTSTYTRKELPTFKDVSFEPWEPPVTPTRTMLNGRD